jgi:CRP-like cAMP-binding protein
MRTTKLIGVRRRAIENQLENLVFRSVSSRLALLLISLTERYGVRDSRGIMLSVKLSQQKLAYLIATVRETTSALLNEFERLGFIDIRHRRIKILDQWALKKIADARVKELSIQEDSEQTDDFAGL